MNWVKKKKIMHNENPTYENKYYIINKCQIM